SDRLNSPGAILRSSPSKLVSLNPLLSISWITRGRASNATRRPAAANIPPAKQPILPAPAPPIGRPAIIPRYLCRFDSRICRPPLLEADAHKDVGGPLPCNRHAAPLCSAARGGQSAGDDDGLTRCTE